MAYKFTSDNRIVQPPRPKVAGKAAKAMREAKVNEEVIKRVKSRKFVVGPEI